ncbi:MATE family efflux transporter [Elongatibacter sediminis]|uniref:MATE family efflux transporter n=1 Tax=Elongatibacter sediminis TaxID=3119006 RepID=A0AAW9RD55_9GAMM
MRAAATPAAGDFTRPHRQIWAIAWPAILANSSAPLVGLVDTWAIGHLPSPVHLAAVGLGTVIFNYLLWAFGFLRMGTTGLVAQARGRENDDTLVATVIRACALSLLFGGALLIFQDALLVAGLRAMAPPAEVADITEAYFRIRIWAAPATLLGYAITGVLFGLARVRAILWLQLLLNVTNGVLNVIFVIGLDMGVPGVAWGTLIAQWLAAVASVWVLLRLLDRAMLVARIRQRATWHIRKFGSLIFLNGFIFIRTLFLMTALALIMRKAGALGDVGMAASHVAMQFMMLMALGLDGFAHAAEALAGAAWGHGRRTVFRRWVWLTSQWAVIASVLYAVGFWLGGDAVTAVLTDLTEVRGVVADLMPLIIALPLVSVWCFQFDGVFIGATAAGAMMVTMGVAFGTYLLILEPLTRTHGLVGLWAAVLIFMGVRGLAQAVWYPLLERRLPAT